MSDSEEAQPLSHRHIYTSAPVEKRRGWGWGGFPKLKLLIDATDVLEI